MNKIIDGVEYVVEEIKGKGQCLVPKVEPLRDRLIKKLNNLSYSTIPSRCSFTVSENTGDTCWDFIVCRFSLNKKAMFAIVACANKKDLHIFCGKDNGDNAVFDSS